MRISKVKGIIIKEIRTGEADKILTILTTKYGKIQAVAKGARRPQSRLIAGTQFLSFGDFILFKGKELYSIRECNVIESFYDIRNSLDKITYTAHIIDLANEVSEENISYYNLQRLLLNTLFMLSKTDKSPELLTRIFELRLLSIIGLRPQVNECVSCGRIDELNYFSPCEGGLICNRCKDNIVNPFEISSSAINAIKYVIYSDFNKIFSFDVSVEVLNELKKVSLQFIGHHIDKKFEKLDFLDLIKGVEKNK